MRYTNVILILEEVNETALDVLQGTVKVVSQRFSPLDKRYYSNS